MQQSDLNGILLMNKPQGFTSHDVVAKLRGILHTRRIGHGGTLDPMATGVLPVFVGGATKAADFAAAQDKEYVAGFTLGYCTDTQDVTGEMLQTSERYAAEYAVKQMVRRFIGPQQQVPPMYSALKVNGKKLYQLARKGKSVERKPRPITIFGLDILRQDAPDHYTIQVTCSKGTYIRTLCHDIGQKLGCGGGMDALRRTEAAGFTLEQAVALEQVMQAAEAGQAQNLLMPVDTYFARYPALTIQGKAERLCRHGNGFPWEGENGRYRVYGSDGSFLMLGEIKDGEMKTVKNFLEVES